MYNSFGETLANEWTPKTVCESRADWLKFEDLSNRDQLEMLECTREHAHSNHHFARHFGFVFEEDSGRQIT